MFSSRIARIPIDLIVSEVIAFPLASETAFRTGITEMDPMVAGSTGALWRGAEDKILDSCPAVSVDELVALRDLNWFHDSGSRYPPPQRPLSGYLRYLARTFLEEHGAYVFVALPPSTRPPGPRFRGSKSARARWFWRWLSFAIPVDLLVAAGEGANGEAIGAKLLTPPMEQRLRDEKFAEVHLHMGAAIEFPVFWVSTLRAIGEIGENRLEENAFESPSASFDNGREFGPWLVRVAIVRYLLAEFLTTGGRRGFREFVDDRILRKLPPQQNLWVG